MPKFIIKICKPVTDDFLTTTAAECCIADTLLGEQEVARIVKVAESAGKIVLLEGKDAAPLCKKLQADGIVADLRESADIKKDMAKLRRECGGFLGVVCRNRRHEAMIVSENEPDFIIFKVWDEGLEKNKQLTDWYSQFFLLQMAVEPQTGENGWQGLNADMVILSPESYKILVAQKERLE